jgi:hypothetical protein
VPSRTESAPRRYIGVARRLDAQAVEDDARVEVVVVDESEDESVDAVADDERDVDRDEREKGR